jgi:hypothetical protein
LANGTKLILPPYLRRCNQHRADRLCRTSVYLCKATNHHSTVRAYHRDCRFDLGITEYAAADHRLGTLLDSRQIDGGHSRRNRGCLCRPTILQMAEDAITGLPI